MHKRILVCKEKYVAGKGISITTLDKLMKCGQVPYVKFANGRVLLPL